MGRRSQAHQEVLNRAGVVLLCRTVRRWPKTLHHWFKDFPKAACGDRLSTLSGQGMTSLLHIWVLGCGSPKE